MAIRRITFKTKPECSTWQQILDMWIEGERIEIFDGGFLFDQFHPIYGDKSGPCLEGWTALSYFVGRTQRIRLGLMVTGVPYRHPAVLAKMAATFAEAVAEHLCLYFLDNARPQLLGPTAEAVARAIGYRAPAGAPGDIAR